jgi:predicted amidohydrolase
LKQQATLVGIQFTAQPGQKEHNLRRAEELMVGAASFNPDLIVLPEVFTTAGAYDQYMELSEEIPGPTIDRLAELARKLSSNVICGSIVERCDGRLFNTTVLLDRQGDILAIYRKIHLFSYYGSREGEVFARGNQAVVAATDIGSIGLTICYDARFPELYRALAQAGATIIASPSAWPYPRLEHWFLMHRSRAVENQVFYIAPNLVGMVGARRYLGNSLIIDPWGSVLACGGEQEGVVVVRIDLDQVDRLRGEFPLHKDYYPEAYRVRQRKP